MTSAPAPRLQEAGDSALVLELSAELSPHVNAHAISIAESVRAEAIAGVLDVVPTYRSVGIHFDPLRTRIEAVTASLHRGYQRQPARIRRNTIEVPVVYGGNGGPDLDDVARFGGLTISAVIARHSEALYRVYMLGFLPGFAYLGNVDPSIAAPRRSTPRLRVPAGSVGIAGVQTGIYPRESPGGWQLIGRTPLTVFDPTRSTPALFSPGDQVRFTPVSGVPREIQPRITSASADAPVAGGRSITVLRPGLLTTVQDNGRWGYQDRGVPVSGPMDRDSHRVANMLVGNPADAATLEATLVGPELRMDCDVMLSMAGADIGATLDGNAIAMHRPIRCRKDMVLRFGPRRSGARVYIAFAGGIDVAPVLRSRATHMASALGPLGGRALRTGDCLPLGTPAGEPTRRSVTPEVPRSNGGARLRVLPGPQDEFFEPAALDVLERTRFTISEDSDRMGYRLRGTTLIPCRPGLEMISDVAFMGSLQVPPSGNPILLMADRPTTGGYPQIATVITADLPAAGQLAPGDWLEFEVCTRVEALAALIAQETKRLALS